MPICTTCVCIDARASRRVRMPRCAHAHAHRRFHVRLAAAISSCMRVWMYMHACVYRWLGIDGRASVCMYMCMRVDPMHACARGRACLRARRERRCNPRSRPLVVCHYVHMYVGMSEPICICKRAYIDCMSARMCVCVCACERASGAARTRATTRLTYVCVCVSTYVYV